MIKIIDKIDHPKLLESFNKLNNEIIWTDYNKCKQCSLQYKTNEDPWNSGVGRGKGQDEVYVNLNSFFANTIFEEIINKYKLFRTRLMWVSPWSCYSMHLDPTPRVHIPIITNPGCYFVFKEGLVEHLENGKVYWVNTLKTHTFINCSEQYRLHLIGAVTN